MRPPAKNLLPRVCHRPRHLARILLGATASYRQAAHYDALAVWLPTMPFPFTLPTTSHLTFQSHLISPTHPSLPVTVTTTRNTLRSTLKHHKSLSPAQQAANLLRVLGVINEYIPYLFTLDAGLSGRSVSGESVDINLLHEIEVEWRSPLFSHPVPGRPPPRVRGRGLDFEMFNVLQSLATVHHLLSRASLLQLHSPATSTLSGFSIDPSTRTSLIQTATKHLLGAHAVHTYLLQLTHHSSDGPPTFPEQAVDIRLPTQSCLGELTLAEATLLFVFKDDPYPALVQQSRDHNDREWMVRAPEVPQVRAHLFARLCFGAAEHAAKATAAVAGEGSRGLAKALVAYCEDLKRMARARGCRFLGLDAEASGKTGEGIAWLRGGLVELGVDVARDGKGERMSFGRLKSSWTERREDRRLEKGKTGDWGADAGKAEEARVLEWLETRWCKENEMVNVQTVPDHVSLVATRVPSGREAFGNQPQSWSPNLLDEDVLARMRAPIEMDNNAGGGMDDDQSSGDEGVGGGAGNFSVKASPGAFPGATGYY